MRIKKEIAKKITRDSVISIFIYALPVVLMFFYFYIPGQRPWELSKPQYNFGFLGPFFKNLNTWGLPSLMVVVGIVEFSLGLYDKRWNRNERLLDITCF